MKDFQASILFWTEYIKHTYFKRSRKIETIHIFHFVLGISANHDISYDSFINLMFEELDNDLVSKSSIYDGLEEPYIAPFRCVS